MKSLFNRLLNNQEEPSDEETVAPIKPPARNRLNKELDVKIAYEYPKGKFRFPLIPDERKHQKQQAPLPKEEKAIARTLPKKEPVKHDMAQKKVRPFTPSEIPSPIYGFNKPAKKEKVEVEYELQGFISSEDVFLGKILGEEVGMTEKASDFPEQQAGTDVPITVEEIFQHKENHLQYIHDMEKVQVEPDTFQVKDELAALLEDGEVFVQEVEPVAFLEDGQVTLKSEGDLNLQVKGDENEDNDAKEAGENIISLEKEEETSQIHSFKAVNPKSEPEKKPAASRSHLPFNVLMLKQDKKKYEENKSWKKQLNQENQPTEIKIAEPELKIADDREWDQSYHFPGIGLLNPPVKAEGDPGWLSERRNMLEQTLFNFNVGAKVVNVTQGPSVTRFELHPEPGVKVNKVTNLSDDIKLSLAARDIRIEAPIPGKHTIGIEVPNPKSRPVLISEIIGSPIFRENASPLTAVLGLDISGNPIVTDLKKMPHGLIAGATGSGKSVCINSILVSLLYKASPDDLKLLLIDPKMVELAPYNRIPHLVSPVITDVKAATASLKWAVEEMERRYELFAHAGVRDINRYNEVALEAKRYSEKLPFIVIIIDELADLMMMSPADVEEAICRIAQKARACGIHLIIATQRPSVDVITGLIKANVPTRIAFSVSSQIDSRTIIDIGGAEKLLGRGDMLFLENGSSKPVRLQGTFVSDAEIDKVVSFAREQRSPAYLFEQEELLKKAQVTEDEDELFFEACEFVVEQGGASTSSLQRRFKVGYNRAARLIDMMEEAGFISGSRGSKPRDVLITESELESLQEAGPVHF
ncbi:DNA translocase FtsK [Bacillus sp. FJAT-27445]|uniref:DNA translocase FtsK n=1 Tax=Bacillus sp. FJAT-27445 TaxID=1679166 RepID=UPI0009E9CFFC|nr:DNA translocase FtsK [Bacillus sp. FJAT-27445]